MLIYLKPKRIISRLMGSKQSSQQLVEYSDCKHFSFVSHQCLQCKKTACYHCFGFPLLAAHAGSIADMQLIEVCKRCFIKGTEIVVGEWWQVVGEQNEKEVIFLHAQGYSRKMFRPHAEQLTVKGYRCILVDLPGHGGLINQQFTLKNSFKIIQQTLTQLCKSSNVSAVGCSFGGLALLEYISDLECSLKKVVLLSCCFKLFSSFDIMPPCESKVDKAREILLKANKNNIDFKVFLNAVEGGLSPLRPKQRGQFLQRLKTQQILQKNKGYIPVLFINGEQQDRRYEQQYFSVSGPHSYLLVYTSSDQFFWCDQTRYFSLLNDITYFLNRQ